MRESLGATKPKGRVKAKAALLGGLGGIPGRLAGAHHRPVWTLPTLKSGGARAYTLGPERW